MEISELIQKLDPGTLLEFLEIDVTDLGDQIYYFHNGGINELNADVTWQGQVYVAFPYEIDGFEMTTSGKFPRPKLKIANVTGLVTPLLKTFDDFIGVKITRKRTFLKYLDAVNFTGGNTSADPNSHFPDDVFYVDRKSSENMAVVEFELASSLDLNKVLLPRRQIIQNTCQWIYKSAECTYAGADAADINDNPGGTPEACGKRLVSCKLRFGNYAVLPYGGFIGAGRL